MITARPVPRKIALAILLLAVVLFFLAGPVVNSGMVTFKYEIPAGVFSADTGYIIGLREPGGSHNLVPVTEGQFRRAAVGQWTDTIGFRGWIWAR